MPGVRIEKRSHRVACLLQLVARRRLLRHESAHSSGMRGRTDASYARESDHIGTRHGEAGQSTGPHYNANVGIRSLLYQYSAVKTCRLLLEALRVGIAADRDPR